MIRGSSMPAVAQTALYAADPLGTLERWSRSYGDTFRARFAGAGDFVFTSSPDHIRTIFNAPPDVLEAGPENAGLVPAVGERSVLVLDGDAHARQRRLVAPQFGRERVLQLGQLIRARAIDAIDQLPIGRTFGLASAIDRLTLDVTIRALFTHDRLARPFADMLAAFGSPAIPLLAYLDIDAVERAPWLRRRMAELDAAVYAEIASRRAVGDERDGLGMLLAARDADGRGLDDRELRDQLVSLVVAGHETVAGALAWAVELLLDHPVALGRATTDRAYLAAAIKESLRLRPVLGVVARRVRTPFSLAGETLAPGTFVAPSIYLTHRRPDLYPEPGVFRPERFVDVKPDPYHWLPFGGGGRRCIGMHFALLEMEMILGALLERVRLRSARPAPAAIARKNITLVPSGGVPVVCTLP